MLSSRITDRKVVIALMVSSLEFYFAKIMFFMKM